MKVSCIQVLILTTLIAVAMGTPPYQPNNGYSSYNYDVDYYAPAYPAYNYGYHIKDPYTYSEFGHEETRKGDNTKGQYQVLLPDGRRQVVTYYVNGKSGFVADVKYIGDAQYPAKQSPYRQY
ncbi:cuticle protein 8-like isoform X1 [Daphnia carinata]|uniref:cuticle protein 8-like isoform X1 n=1 Tax=Daphnia carinata TaxID=120202 RepID=UPI00257D2B77|nr:cuticle protein 8-like isoform X1 [Daphnia carinata]